MKQYLILSVFSISTNRKPTQRNGRFNCKFSLIKFYADKLFNFSLTNKIALTIVAVTYRLAYWNLKLTSRFRFSPKHYVIRDC